MFLWLLHQSKRQLLPCLECTNVLNNKTSNWEGEINKNNSYAVKPRFMMLFGLNSNMHENIEMIIKTPYRIGWQAMVSFLTWNTMYFSALLTLNCLFVKQVQVLEIWLVVSATGLFSASSVLTTGTVPRFLPMLVI